MESLWQVNNISPNAVTVLCRVENLISKGFNLNKDEFVLCMPQITSVLDAQKRRRLININETFDNSLYELEIGKVYNASIINEADKNSQKQLELEEQKTKNLSPLEQAEQDALKYMKG